MADRTQKYDDNVQGRWYVDKKCILCSVCAETAPSNFKESDHHDHDVVYKQPINSDEELQCEEAKEACPVEAIGDDG